MKLVFVHGIGQGQSTEEDLKQTWTGALKEGCANALVELPEGLDIKVAFYGRILDEAIANSPGTARSRGSEDPFDSFEATLLMEIADRADITDADIAAELPANQQEAVQRGIRDAKVVQATSRALFKRSRVMSDEFIRIFFPDVHAYMLWRDVREQVNEVVSQALRPGPTVVVGHSLGSVVVYWTLTELQGEIDIPLMVTLGSPLGFPSIRDNLPRPLTKPSGVVHWLNAADVRDPVALFPRLERDHFPGVQVENLSDVRNPEKNRHGIDGYLADTFVAMRIANSIALR
ncbi:hypothetical protein ACIQK6_38240 [Streptomyces sp. NPDC091682]|uniref:hypothetical protein n=1 Tax=Streptomyces sp. NPDC091682 TaxID=3366005 RepID=UPI0038003A8A